MTPNVDERLASIVRALSEVILPHLPPEASLAQEQVHLCIGHLQILRAQFDAVPAFEREELDDAVAVARDLAGTVTGGEQTTAALAAMNAAVAAADGGDVRGQRAAVLEAVDALVKAVSADGSSNAKVALPGIILSHEAPRTLKDRQWFAPFGFDTL
ncbi:hypothetical protein [Novosphingobium sp. NDB2Meth1]|jgi:hypothetical protein|uniref:hypothetical protein n=1 Tax=Novosphingobium sp. NDB2Meth1 TaxID=1892847 RepID=UPI0009F941C3|nr:hypothetical protein [Novosphingobium sp. NDB2Meth1]